MKIHESIVDVIGQTPLVRLKGASEATRCEIFGKAEFLNPGQSVKDRAALFIIRDAEHRGELRPRRSPRTKARRKAPHARVDQRPSGSPLRLKSGKKHPD